MSCPLGIKKELYRCPGTVSGPAVAGHARQRRSDEQLFGGTAVPPRPFPFWVKEETAQTAEGCGRLPRLSELSLHSVEGAQRILLWSWTPRLLPSPLHPLAPRAASQVPWKSCLLESGQKGNRGTIPCPPPTAHWRSWLLCHFYDDSVVYSTRDNGGQLSELSNLP